MKVGCDVEHTDMENDHGREIPAVVVTCSRCGHQTCSYGQTDASVRRCFALMHEECPEKENNYYTEEKF